MGHFKHRKQKYRLLETLVQAVVVSWRLVEEEGEEHQGGERRVGEARELGGSQVRAFRRCCESH